MAAKKPRRPVSSGHGERHPLTDFRRVVEEACRGNTPVRITIPAIWARKSMPILSPDALRNVEIDVIPGDDSEFHLVRGGKK